MDLPQTKKLSVYQVVLPLLALLFSTYLRISLLFIYPFLVVFLFYFFHWKLDRNAVYLLVFVFFSWLLSFRNGFDIKYNLVSLYFFLPFMLLLFAIAPKSGEQRNHVKVLFNCLTFLAVINNIAGIVQYILNPYDDSFSGIYGTFTVSQNGLALLNTVLLFYHFTVFQHHKKKLSLVFSAFFLISMVMGFYGAGLMVFILTLMLTYFRVKRRNIIQLVFFTAITIAGAILLMKLISPLTLDYNFAIIDRFLHGSGANVPRKLTIFKNYFHGYTSNIPDLLFGSGPGTFNSRSAFMVGSPTYFKMDFIKSDFQPHYFREYAYTLWNPSNTGPYDGFMNQPFTSILAILGEYGLILTSGMLYLLVNRFKYIVKLGNRMAKNKSVSVEFKVYKFCSIFALLLVIIDNYMEYPEIIALLLIIVKLSENQLRRAFDV